MQLKDFLQYFGLDTFVDIRDDEYMIFKGMLRDFPIELEYRDIRVTYVRLEENSLCVEVSEV